MSVIITIPSKLGAGLHVWNPMPDTGLGTWVMLGEYLLNG